MITTKNNFLASGCHCLLILKAEPPAGCLILLDSDDDLKAGRIQTKNYLEELFDASTKTQL